MKVKFTKDFLTEELDLPYSAMEDNITETTRWSEIHNIVFKYEDKFYHTWYSCGATEYQDESPWEFDDEVECEEVHKVEKVMKVWEPVSP